MGQMDMRMTSQLHLSVAGQTLARALFTSDCCLADRGCHATANMQDSCSHGGRRHAGVRAPRPRSSRSSWCSWCTSSTR